MSNKAVTQSLFGIISGFFLCYFLIFNNIILKDKPIEQHLNNIIEYANEGNWVEAKNILNKLEDDWNRIKYPLTLNYAEADYSLFLELLGRMRSSIKSEDANQTASDATAALSIWGNYMKVIPLP